VEVWGKRLSLLKEAVPGLKRPGYLTDRVAWKGSIGQVLRQAADRLGLSLAPAFLPTDVDADSYSRLFEDIKSSGADGLVVGGASANIHHHRVIASLAAKHRLPAVYPLREFVADGGLLSYGPDLPELFRLEAGQIAKLFGGAKVIDVPWIQPTKYQLIANVKAAEAIGLTLPSSLLLGADVVIE
jgi:putative ABC transport system substrate-binding protein